MSVAEQNPLTVLSLNGDEAIIKNWHTITCLKDFKAMIEQCKGRKGHSFDIFHAVDSDEPITPEFDARSVAYMLQRRAELTFNIVFTD